MANISLEDIVLAIIARSCFSLIFGLPLVSDIKLIAAIIIISINSKTCRYPID